MTTIKLLLGIFVAFAILFGSSHSQNTSCQSNLGISHTLRGERVKWHKRIRQKTRGIKFLKKNSFQVRAGPVKGTETRQGSETQEHNPTTEWWHVPLWPPKQCTCMPSSLCCVQSKLGMQVHCVGGQRWGSHHSLVGLCSRVFSSLPCFCLFYRSSPNLKSSFFRNFSPSFCSFFGGGGGCQSSSNYKTNSFIASDKIVFATRLQIWFHTADERIHG